MIKYKGCTRLAAWLVVAAIFLLSPATGMEARAQSEEASTGGGGVLFILDGSGSMAGQIDGKPKMDIAKEVMINAIKAPEMGNSTRITTDDIPLNPTVIAVNVADNKKVLSRSRISANICMSPKKYRRIR